MAAVLITCKPQKIEPDPLTDGRPKIISLAFLDIPKKNVSVDQNNLLLITNASYGGAKGGVPAPNVIAHPNNGRAYGIVSLAASADQLVAAHELSHLYGCNHEGAGAAYGLYYSKAIVYNAGGQKTITLVASGPGGAGASRLLRYSYPTTTGSGPALTDCNNTQVMNVNAGGVKNFRPEPNVLSGNIEGPYSGLAYHMYTFEAVTSCGSAPYSYQWRVSSDGFSYSSVLGTGEYFNTHLYHNGNHLHYIKLTVTSADNQTRETTYQVYVNDDGSGYRIGAQENEQESLRGGIVYPNPVTSSANLTLNLTLAGKVTVDIYSIGGAKIASPVKQVMEIGKHTLTIPLEKFRMADGTYLIKVQTPEGQKTHKINYQHALN